MQPPDNRDRSSARGAKAPNGTSLRKFLNAPAVSLSQSHRAFVFFFKHLFSWHQCRIVAPCCLIEKKTNLV